MVLVDSCSSFSRFIHMFVIPLNQRLSASLSMDKLSVAQKAPSPIKLPRSLS